MVHGKASHGWKAPHCAQARPAGLLVWACRLPCRRWPLATPAQATEHVCLRWACLEGRGIHSWPQMMQARGSRARRGGGMPYHIEVDTAYLYSILALRVGRTGIEMVHRAGQVTAPSA